MAVDLGDPNNGFRHADVMQFINSEICSNGGDSDFYLTFRSRSWKEVEDGLHTILADQQVALERKRASTWSALALGVRAAARLQEQQGELLQRLQKQMEEHETGYWALASETQRMRGERDQATAQLHLLRAALRQALDEREMFRRKLLQAEWLAQAHSLPQEVVLIPGTEQHRAAQWLVGAQKQTGEMAARAQGTPHLGTQMPAPRTLLYVQEPPRSWAQPVPPPLRVPVPHQFPFHAPFPVRVPYSTPLPFPAVMGSEATATTTAGMEAGEPRLLPTEMYLQGFLAAVGSQEEAAPLWDQSQGTHSENIQDGGHQEDGGSHRAEKNPECPQEMTSTGNSSKYSKEEVSKKPQETDTLGNSSSYSWKEEEVKLQGTASLGDSSSHTQKEDPQCCKGMAPLGNSSSHRQQEVSEGSQETGTLGDSSSHGQKEELVVPLSMTALEGSSSQSQKEEVVKPQETAVLVDGSSHSQKEEMVVPQGMAPPGDSKIQDVMQSHTKQQVKIQKAKQPRRRKASKSQQQKSVSQGSPDNWVCSRCKGVNPSSRVSCHKCRKICKPGESGGADSEQTH
ncbi:PREDICTED: uncharacterized protein LOC102028852 [Chinchilla lanigera]|uniref:uncharacterized protein LOC102028852 n=1 Tax=Chinchilla lanigera TaxID=34839 RepID=UPI00038EF3F1|nr:PREDICTED: uncharacterized protein LOC102028852 [Chinchilla lanigera]